MKREKTVVVESRLERGFLRTSFPPLIRKEGLLAMINSSSTTSSTMWVAIDIAKAHNEVLIEAPHGRRRHFRVANTVQDFAKFTAFLSSGGYSCRVAFGATGDYQHPFNPDHVLFRQ